MLGTREAYAEPPAPSGNFKQFIENCSIPVNSLGSEWSDFGLCCKAMVWPFQGLLHTEVKPACVEYGRKSNQILIPQVGAIFRYARVQPDRGK